MKTTKYTITSRKVIALALVFVLLATMFVGCNGSKDEETSTTTTTTEVQTTIEVVTEIVTDEDGETVTDDNGEALTTEVTKVVEITSQSDEETSSENSNSTISTTKGSTTTTKQTETTTKKTTSTSNSNKVTTITKPTSTSCSHSWSSYKWGKTEETFENKYRTCSKCGKSESWEFCNHSFGSWYNINIWNDEHECSKCGWIEEKEVDNRDDYMGSKSEYLEFLGYLNQARREAGVSEVQYCDELQSGANTRAKELTVKYSHTRPNGSDSSTAFNTDKYVIAGENIAGGQSAKQVFTAWMNSEGHRKSMLGNALTHICVARCDNRWVLILAIDAGKFDGVWE